MINIEREANLSGLHDKECNIMRLLAGSLRRTSRSRWRQHLLRAIVPGVDGDSASSTEIYALASALSRIARCGRISP